MGLPEMHHVIAHSQSIVYPPEILRGQWPPLRAIASLFIILPYYSDDLSNFIYILNYLNKIICRLSASFRSCLHCIATRVAMRVVKGSQCSPRSSVSFTLNSEVKWIEFLVYSFWISHKILRSIQCYKLFSDQPKNKEVKILSRR